MAKMLLIIDLPDDEVEGTIHDLRMSGHNLDFINDMIQDDLASGNFSLWITPDPLPRMAILHECGLEVR